MSGQGSRYVMEYANLDLVETIYLTEFSMIYAVYGIRVTGDYLTKMFYLSVLIKKDW